MGLDRYDDRTAKYQEAVMEQYKLYVETADRVSQRTAAVMTFFLTLNAGVFTIIGAIARARDVDSLALLTLALVVGLSQSAIWYALARHYRQLLTAKYFVVGVLEARLPSSPYYGGEWHALGRGLERRLYVPITRFEAFAPGVSAAAYLAAYLLVILS